MSKNVIDLERARRHRYWTEVVEHMVKPRCRRLAREARKSTYERAYLELCEALAEGMHPHRICTWRPGDSSWKKQGGA